MRGQGKQKNLIREGKSSHAHFSFITGAFCYLLLSRKPVSKCSSVIPSMTITFYFKLYENLQVLWLVVSRTWSNFFLCSDTHFVTGNWILHLFLSWLCSCHWKYVLSRINVVRKKQDWWHLTRKYLSECLREKICSGWFLLSLLNSAFINFMCKYFCLTIFLYLLLWKQWQIFTEILFMSGQLGQFSTVKEFWLEITMSDIFCHEFLMAL